MAGRFNPVTLEFREHFLVYDPPPDDFHMEYESLTLDNPYEVINDEYQTIQYRLALISR
ncbi:MAG: hypothetical protein IPJ07_09200 [Acidobacteria bacterium]|nr:hypothetical protein [Acidobacteriota bacterium]